MRKKEKTVSKNYLEQKPGRPEGIPWSADEKGIVTLDIENKGFFHWLAQHLFHKPRVTHVHLDELGSFIWSCIDGKKDLIAIGREVEAEFGDKASPLYERLAKYFQILDSYHFVVWEKDPE